MGGFARAIKRRGLKEQIEGFKTLFKESQPFVKAIEKLKEAKQEGYIAGYKARLLEEKQEAEKAKAEAEALTSSVPPQAVQDYVDSVDTSVPFGEVRVVDSLEPTVDVSQDNTQDNGSAESEQQAPVS